MRLGCPGHLHILVLLFGALQVCGLAQDVLRQLIFSSCRACTSIVRWHLELSACITLFWTWPAHGSLSTEGTFLALGKAPGSKPRAMQGMLHQHDMTLTPFVIAYSHVFSTDYHSCAV